jgi:branched-chain amino acid transport system substrate-binding protein
LYGYEAAAVGIAAIEKAIQEQGGKKPTRKQVSEAVRKIKDYKGITGPISFDSKGDPVKAKYFVLKFEKKQYPGKVVKIVESAAPPAKKL